MANRRKKWLYVRYKAEHPELYGKQRGKIDFAAYYHKVRRRIVPILIILILNIIAICLMMLLNEDIRLWIFLQLQM